MSKQFDITRGEQLRMFTLDLLKETTNFPKYILNLLEKHFKFGKMVFFPYPYAVDGIGSRSKRDALWNIVTLNIDYLSMKAYEDYVAKIDIFAPKSLPISLKSKKVLFTEDIMPIDKYKKTEYYKQVARYDLVKQACIYLRRGDEIIATICIFRSEKELSFSQTEREFMEYLSDLISRHYTTSLMMSSDMLSQNGFNLFFRSSGVGAIMLNQQLSVLMANELAYEYCGLFMDLFEKKQTIYARSNYPSNSKYEVIQHLINWIGLDLIKAKDCIKYTSMFGEFIIYHWPFVVTNIFSNIETRYIVEIMHHKKSVSPEFIKIYNTLTYREKEVLDCIASGYNNEQIRQSLTISINTIRTHISNLYKKFDVNSRVELLMVVNESKRDI